jgi:DNA-binding Lrp family transcriptional regulator
MENNAFLFARINIKNEQEVLEKVQKINGVDYAVLLFGKEDLLAKLSAKNVDVIYKETLSKLREIPGLEATKIFLCKGVEDE